MSDQHKREQFWDKQHKANCVPTLSGTTYQQAVEALRIAPFIKPEIKVLEIGCGLGYVTQGFRSAGCNVSVLDISDLALERVARIATAYSVHMLEWLPSDKFDLAIGLHVVQHVPTAFLKEELGHVLRSMKADGVLALQFVSAKGIEDDGLDVAFNAHELGNYRRSPECMVRMLEGLGGVCERIDDGEFVLKHCNTTGNHIIHVRRQG